MKYNAVIFDLFGTLVDNFSFQEHQRVLSAMAAALSAPPHDFVRLWLETFHERATGVLATTEANIKYICQTLSLPVAPDAVTAAARIRLEFTRRALTPRPDAVDMLACLQAASYKTGLISDCSADVPILWPDPPFAALVDVPIFSCAVGLKKPDPRIYHLVCERLAVIPQHCLYVGDGSSRELTGAAQVGMHAVLIRVPCEDSYDAHRVDAEEWQGATVSALNDILTLVE